MNIKITRESVGAADDLDSPHEKLIRNIEKKTISDIITELKDDYLPKNVKNGSTWIICQDIDPLAIIEYPRNLVKYYKNIDYKIINREKALYAKCMGSKTIKQYENNQSERNKYSYISIENGLLIYKENDKIEKIELEECRINWERYINASSEFKSNNYINQKCIGFCDSSSNPMKIVIYGNKEIKFEFKSCFEHIQSLIFRSNLFTFKKMYRVIKSIRNAGWTLFDYS